MPHGYPPFDYEILFEAKIAAPIPLTPAPNIAILLLTYLSFNVTIVSIAKKIPTIQNLVTILLS